MTKAITVRWARLTLAAVLMLAAIAVQRANADAVASILSRQPDGVVLQMNPGVLRMQAYSDRVMRVTYSPQAQLPGTKSLSVIAEPSAPVVIVKETPDAILVAVGSLHASVDRKTGNITFLDAKDRVLLQETGRTFDPTPLKGVAGTSAAQRFALQPDEAIYGLGQHQHGAWNYRGSTVHLQQRNTDIAIPMLISSKGYGLLWDNPAIADVAVGDKGAENTLSWKSEVGDAVDYYFMYGPSPDQIIHGYRQLTGAAPMLGKWVFGYWQSRERYVTQQQLLDVAREYRKRQIPIDGMVQDWQYWFPQPWGSHAFGTNFPDPRAMMAELHAAHFHAIISVWAKFDQGSKNFDELSKAGFLYSPIYPNVYPAGKSQWYDAFNPDARKMYWRQMSDEIFSTGFDGWWLDATEPELGGKWGEIRNLTTHLGPGYSVANAYPLMTTSAVYQGQRAQTSDKRVFILTRSAYAGQQRNAAISWSGDIAGNWATFKTQIPAGLNFVASGIPYWNTDIGGFFSGSNADEEYRELFVRWFQFGSFCPLFRVHGTNTQKEMWSFGPQIEPILVKYDRLRYRLLPYIYSAAWKVTSEDYTLMRPLIMDFGNDAKSRTISDQFMFGPSLMACPVTEPRASSATVVPAANLAGTDGNPGGLSATYYQGENFEQEKFKRKDPTISFNWDHVKREGVGENLQRDPIPGLAMDHFSARWEGFLLTNDAGDYRLSLKADDGMRMWVDGKLMIQDWASRKAVTRAVTVNLPAHAKVPVKIEYYQNLHDAIIELRWQQPGASAELMRSVYLPPGNWRDFWTGKELAGGQTVLSPSPLETMPLFVRAGAIIPMGPNVQYATEKSDPIEVRVYRGADGVFTLYEDEGDSYDYEKKAYSTIQFSWNENAGTLTIGPRAGTFPGMLKERDLRIVFVGQGHGVGEGETEKADQTVRYAGEQVAVKRN